MLASTSTAPRDAVSETRLRSSPRLWLGTGQRLWLEHAGKTVSVQPVRCFPWSAPGELVSLRDADEQEHYLVEALADLDPASRVALSSAMQSAGFVLEVEAILSIEEDYEVRVWQARTRHGLRTFQTRLDEWPWAAPDGGYLIRDLCGDLFRLPPSERMDETSRHCLWAYVG
jgi:Domain of unknown function (DUF1854)